MMLISARMFVCVGAVVLSGCSMRPNRTQFLPTPYPNRAQKVTIPSSPIIRQCNGKRIGTYAWNQAYWRNNDGELFDFLDSAVGREWACGDLSVSIGDYSNPTKIHDVDRLLPFLIKYREKVLGNDQVVWLIYGDVVEKSGEKMIQFTQTFFNWAASIPEDVAAFIGPIGISYDVEHLRAEDTKAALLMAQELKSRTKFRPGTLLVQHTIEGDPNVVGTDYVMRYADSALAMVYRNYITDPTGKYQADSNMVSRLMWMLNGQCPNCLDDAYSRENYKAKITVMVEAACRMGNGCGKLSFCAHDREGEGAVYMNTVLEQTNQLLISDGHMTKGQFDRLFSKSTPFAVHNWEWYRCYAPFSNSLTYASCKSYHQYAEDCRKQ
jgi:hypothetical protein